VSQRTGSEPHRVPAPEPGIREHPVPKPHLEGYFVVFGGWTQGISDAGGIPAGSRWLSAATPPVTGSRGIASRQGCQPRQDVDRTPLRFLDRGFLDAAGTLRGVGRSSGVGLRWCRCAQPPATRFDPSGIDRVAPEASIELTATVNSEEPLWGHAPVGAAAPSDAGHCITHPGGTATRITSAPPAPE